MPSSAAPVSFLEQAFLYQIDRWQRSVLFLDILRERANNMMAHDEAGMPPPLAFEYETVLDARRFEMPANYALLRITRCDDDRAEDCVDDNKPPVIIIDPRAGHGPGLGGFKRDSEVGMALHEGHATYFVIFFPLPSPNQTLADVLHALRRFVEEVSNRHHGKAPVLYGNCQAGWASMLLAADCEGLSGVTVLNGSPLSYWAGASDANPMRLGGGLMGGSWLAHWLADLGNGRLDGAWLVQNFENLNPANTLWDKNYNVFAHIDTERERFLEFERWWTGYHFLSREEILSIIEDLFIGNKLERGTMKICTDCYIDLTRIRNPIVIFASSSDNITPPHQALNWIPTVYPTTADLKNAGQRIVYLLNTHVGHLGIFVSASVAKLEHRAILESIGDLDALQPGLYEMKISNPTGDPDCRKPQYTVSFEEREVEQINYAYPERSFEKVQAVSEWNELLYKTTISPWITAFANPWSAEILKRLHPMRIGTKMFSEKLNPWMWPLKMFAPFIAIVRLPVDETNEFVAMEGEAGASISRTLDSYRKSRDSASEQLFSTLYGVK
ncbi:DUF3141 domain-containing protein [Noviherbaspirillum sp. CPCC 100848]|uniref:DUF3141 domain-containing protein n=1 Tax=Noviherbaspirillum album TaxID=3080276 RepID=A0ABU6J391_9BURK|nr:DUF3141 domain-containing protein [Noviherbaspirillum sp. CPCC 100848]MEC4718087.1 DUF3141 domain-containing protein [Noviherbaspirillum sp. CPCC 100848]